MPIIEEERIISSPDCCGSTVEDGNEIDGFAEFRLKSLDDPTAVEEIKRCRPGIVRFSGVSAADGLPLRNTGKSLETIRSLTLFTLDQTSP